MKDNPWDKITLPLTFDEEFVGSSHLGQSAEIKRRILLSGPNIDLEKVVFYPNKLDTQVVALLRVAFRPHADLPAD